MHTRDKKLIKVLKGSVEKTPPIWLMRQAGRYLPEYLATRAKSKNFLHFCYSPDLAEEVTLQPIRKYAFDAAILFADILVIPDALGQDVKFIKGEGPKLAAITEASMIPEYDTESAQARLGPIYETLRRLTLSLPSETSLIGFAGAPWTVATYMIEGGGSKDYATIRTFAYQNEAAMEKLMDVLVESTAAYLIKQIENGAEAVQLFDSWAGVLPREQFYRWVIGPNKRIFEKIRAAHPDVPIIGFPRGAGPLYVDYIEECGPDAVGVDQTVPVKWAAEHIQPRATVQGNLDNLLVVAGGTKMEDAIKEILDTLSGGPLVFNLGHGIVPQTPPENVQKLVDLVRSYTA